MDIERLKSAAEKCTPLNLDSAELERGDDVCIDCPVCGGEGYVDLEKDFCNIDGHAIGVQFYGIGNEFGAGEEYFREASPAKILALIAQRDELLAALKPILERVRDFEDCGPYGETWQSDELIGEINFADEVIAKCEDKK